MSHARSGLPLVVALAVAPACGASVPPSSAPSAPAPAHTPAPSAASRARFKDDVALLQRHGEVVVLESPSGGRVAVSPTYQARVMTSAVGPDDESLGFVHRAFIEAGKTGTQFDNYGGEDRFWLGPEGGQYGLYFPKGAPFTFAAWQTPAAFQEGAWVASERAPNSLTFQRKMSVESRLGARFDLDVTRALRVLDAADVQRHLGVAPTSRVRWVAFESRNAVTNAGAAAWTEATGLLSVWILGMFAPARDAKVIVPFNAAAEGPVVNDAYFGKVPPERLVVRGAALIFTCDGEYRSKIGLGPARARSVAGSYSPGARLLTVVHYDKPEGARRYVNSMWEEQREPFAGDVLNSYNDGPPAPGKPPLGGFYELETSSPAAALRPGETLTHTHRTFHFVGDAADLEPIAKAVLGVSLAELR